MLRSAISIHIEYQEMFEIESFWLPRLGKHEPQPSSSLKGWTGDPGITDGFVEPALSLKIGDPATSDVIIVAAPGAVGKTTFAKTIAHLFGLAYVDLAETTPIGGNFFSGGITRAFGKDALNAASQGRLGLVVDGLDEAQMRITPEGFAAGIEDLATLTEMKSPPVLFGRSLAAEETWLTLSAAGRRPCLLEIDFFDDVRAENFIATRMATLAKGSPKLSGAFGSHRDRFIALGIETRRRLVSVGGSDSIRFTGYAPILDAICSFALDEDELNPQSKLSHLNGQTQIQLINAVCDAVLLREQAKVVSQLVAQFPGEDPNLIRSLYGPNDQRARLSAALLGSATPAVPALKSAALGRAYIDMVGRFFPSHPFFDGTGKRPANAVFAADLLVDSLVAPQRKDAALQSARADQRLITGLIFDLYVERITTSSSEMPLQDVGLLYEALKAQTGAQQRATLEITQADESDADIAVQFEIVNRANPETPERLYGPFKSSAQTPLELRTPMSNVFVSAAIWATLGDSAGLLIDAPCEVDVSALTIAAKQVLVQRSPDTASDASVALLAEEADTMSVQDVTVQGATLLVSWPNARQHPWINFAYEPPAAASPDLEFMRGRLRKILTAFRSHSKGALVRLAAKINHLRTTKDTRGVFLVQRLLSDGVLSSFEAGKFYVLNARKLAELVNINYHALQLKQYTKELDSYLEDVLKDFHTKTS
jgi:hypothetical protein